MTKTKSPRNDGAVATIPLDGIRTAAREVRTLFPEAQRPAINTLMNTMTRALGLGPSYGYALDAAREVSAPAALSADHLLTITAKLTCPEWVRVMMNVFGVVHRSNETYRGKPVYDLRFNDVPMTGSPADAGRAAEDFIAAHPILGRDDVKIRKIEAEVVEPVRRPAPTPPGIRPVPKAYDPYFAQALPAGFWSIESTLLFELDRSGPLEALLRRVAKASFYDGANKTYQPSTTLALRNGPDEKPLLAVHVKRNIITADPRTALTSSEGLPEILEKKMRIKITAKEKQAFKQAQFAGQVILSMTHAPIAFRLDPVCQMNGRTVAAHDRPALVVDTGAALAGVSPRALDDGKRSTETDAMILSLAGVPEDRMDSYRITLLRPVKPQPIGGMGFGLAHPLPTSRSGYSR